MCTHALASFPGLPLPLLAYRRQERRNNGRGRPGNEATIHIRGRGTCDNRGGGGGGGGANIMGNLGLWISFGIPWTFMYAKTYLHLKFKKSHEGYKLISSQFWLILWCGNLEGRGGGGGGGGGAAAPLVPPPMHTKGSYYTFLTSK